MTERRVVDLELRYMDLERIVEALNQVVIDQGKLIARLREDLRQVQERMLASQEGPARRLEDDEPPHY